jgi:hypothetical protein
MTAYQLPKTRRITTILTALSLAVLPLMFWVGQAAAASQTLSVPKTTGVHFKGVIKQDECATTQAPIGDAGCTITVNHRVVTVLHGNTVERMPWGHIISFEDLKTNYTGRHVDVYAAKTSKNAYTLGGSNTYYIELLNR